MMISVILEASENVDMIYIAGDKNHVSNSMEILCTIYLDLEVQGSRGSLRAAKLADGKARRAHPAPGGEHTPIVCSLQWEMFRFSLKTLSQVSKLSHKTR